MPGRLPEPALVLAFTALLGCGASDNEAQPSRSPETVHGEQRRVLETIDALQTAGRRGDGLQICETLFTKSLVRSIETRAKRSCPAEVRKRLFTREQTISVGRAIRVSGTTASAVIREQNDNISTLHLLKQGGQWRINRVTPRKASRP
jgi:hypothetical protein